MVRHRRIDHHIGPHHVVVFVLEDVAVGRLLKTPGGHVVTLAYWEQKENMSHDEVPYYETNT